MFRRSSFRLNEKTKPTIIASEISTQIGRLEGANSSKTGSDTNISRLNSPTSRRRLLSIGNCLNDSLCCAVGKFTTKQRQPTFESSFRRFFVSLTALKLTSTSTSTSTTVTSTTSTTGSITALLKLILIGCYYAIALVSLLTLLMLYLNHVAATSTQSAAFVPSSMDNKSRQFELDGDKRDLDELGGREVVESGQKSMQKTDIKKQNYLRFKRAAAGSEVGTGAEADKRKDSLEVQSRVADNWRQSTKMMNGNDNMNKINNHHHHQRRPTNDHDDHGGSLSATNKSKLRPDSRGSKAQDQRPSWSSIGGNKSPPELTERHASYSANNRGSMAAINGSFAASLRRMTPIQPLESQWIPIVNPREAANLGAHQQTNEGNEQDLNHHHEHPFDNHLMSSTHTGHNLPNSELVHETHQRSNHHEHHRIQSNNYHLNHHYPHHNKRQHDQTVAALQSQHSVRRWRRPRLNGGFPPLDMSGSAAGGGYRPIRRSRMYKKVLLCDKTLVSLDYIRNFDFEPKPFAENELDLDNIIDDFDSNQLDQIHPIHRRASAANNSSSESLPATTLAEDSFDELPLSSSPVDFDTRRSTPFLSDEDPLVKCDMWDLEKGLKNRKPPSEILRMAVRADFDTVRGAINRCRQLSEKTLPPDDEFGRDGLEIMSTEDLVSLFSIKRGLIPGTKWCGLGDQASSYNDLGSKHRIDICCRAHDHCPIRLKPFRNDYGVLNIALYTKSHCDCDADFYRCLRDVRSRTADMLGNLYFNVLALQCMREERMRICRVMKPIALGFERCVRYENSPVKTVFRFTTPPVAY